MSRQSENLKTLEKLSEQIPSGEQLRFYYRVVLELAKEIGVRRFYLAVKATRRYHGL